ncbi:MULTISPECIES: GNAT family N-acetyltransferase [Halolamina]|uniref:Ribosomal protein S18 acetylase RimI n=1 Tax=Halolamina pelagica TaxID=699431 RepID=A0A1I5NPK0_9EURY|nr:MULTISPECIES: GNAT family N-acetyltransferase [Halolamina]NHX36419.1 GNAT family N-acetyltransferase [Halolamina sp. R1-12]SFP23758.1 Ribosomal protein S18 acetylase RimI [Halolamina pelagica]
MIEKARRGVRGLLARIRPPRIRPTDPPSTVVDGEEREIRIRPFRDGDVEGLVEMYDAFDPEQRAQGTPPIQADEIRTWIEGLLEGVNVVALHDGEPVGHVSFVPDGTDRHELAIFVHQEYQHAGIGTELMAAGLGHAREQGVEYIWLTVESWKRGIQRFYSRAGFSTVNPMGAAHRMSRTL